MLAILVLLYHAMWGPFEPGTEPRALPVRRVEGQFVEGTIRFPFRSLTFQHAAGEEAFVVAEMNGVKRVEVARGFQLPREAFIADFNSDKRDDIALFVPSG